MTGGAIDTHAHLCDSRFDHDLDKVLDRAAKSGVKAVVTVGETLDDAKRNLQLAHVHPMVWAAAGLYPTKLDLNDAAQMLEFIRRWRHQLVAIGEVGLDYWMVQTDKDRELQRQIFNSFIELSLELDLPLNVHSRSAGRHVLSMLLANGVKKVQMHAFDGKASAALPGVEAGFHFSIPPSIIRSRQKQKLIKHLPLSCLLVETDSPVLGPDSGRRNEPVNVNIALEAISDLKGISIERVKERLYQNTITLYGDRILNQSHAL